LNPLAPKPSSPPNPERRRQANALKITIVFLLAAAVVVATLVKGLPLPLRLVVAGMDVFVAAVLFVMLRQKFRGV
jgi:hypothetical protein